MSFLDSPRNSLSNLLKKTSFSQCLFLSLVLLVIAYNLPKLINKTNANMQLREHIPFTFSGYKFAGLEGYLKKVRYLGYYTDKNMDENKNAAQFAQAQYILAPTILELNNLNHDFLIFDCSTPVIALAKVKEINAIPLKKNQFGIIFAKRQP